MPQALMRQFTANALTALISIAMLCSLRHAFAESEFDVPPDISPAGISGSQVLNLYPGGALPEGFLLQDASTLNVYGGTIGNFLYAIDSSVINVYGGNSDSVEYGSGIPGIPSDAVINLYGGSLGDFAYFLTTTNIYGGDSGKNATINGLVNWHGGLLQDNFLGGPEGVLNVFGSSLLIDGLPVLGLEPGKPLPILNRDIEVSGILENGDAFVFQLTPASGNISTPGRVFPTFLTTFTLVVPEPSSLALGLFCSLFLVWRRR